GAADHCGAALRRGRLYDVAVGRRPVSLARYGLRGAHHLAAIPRQCAGPNVGCYRSATSADSLLLLPAAAGHTGSRLLDHAQGVEHQHADPDAGGLVRRGSDRLRDGTVDVFWPRSAGATVDFCYALLFNV